MSKIDYASKYLDLKQKYIQTVDLAWRLGYEQGLHDSQIDQAQQKLQQAQMDAQNGMPGEEDESVPGEEGQEVPQGEAPNAGLQEDELGQHIEKLESMLGKSELSSLDLGELKKTLSDIRSLQTSINLMKSMESSKKVKMHKSLDFKLTPKMQANLPQHSQKSMSLQKKIIDNIFQKWEQDSKKASSDITNILNIDGLTKKD